MNEREHHDSWQQAAALAAQLASSLEGGTRRRVVWQQLFSAEAQRPGRQPQPPVATIKALQIRSRGNALATIGVVLEATQLSGSDPAPVLAYWAENWRGRAAR